MIPPDGAVAGAPAEPLLELRGVRAAYGSIEVLHGVDLSVPPGTVVALLVHHAAGRVRTAAADVGVGAARRP